MTKKQKALITLKMILWWKKYRKSSIKQFSVSSFKSITNSNNRSPSDWVKKSFLSIIWMATCKIVANFETVPTGKLAPRIVHTPQINTSNAYLRKPIANDAFDILIVKRKALRIASKRDNQEVDQINGISQLKLTVNWLTIKY